MTRKETGKEEIGRAISIVELKRDRDQLIQQLHITSGAIRYLEQKITELSKPEEKEVKENATQA